MKTKICVRHIDQDYIGSSYTKKEIGNIGYDPRYRLSRSFEILNPISVEELKISELPLDCTFNDEKEITVVFKDMHVLKCCFDDGDIVYYGAPKHSVQKIYKNVSHIRNTTRYYITLKDGADLHNMATGLYVSGPELDEQLKSII
ncbi:hypothetical protein [Robertkochia solimangrovi]|uniref:hypothetical protein n=1 Tax=Robertkochia solimangrovi TaxID=2213046 RepID=UPI00117C837E|nr:hypothetical protein [Robertkochia solimangrovi]TRZ41668.1 hypothetical protein DMZ48_16810 [Robertkochia solimangrovi]